MCMCVCVCVCEGPDDRCHFFPIPATKFSGFNGLAEKYKNETHQQILTISSNNCRVGLLCKN